MKVWIVLPTYNEAENIGDLVPEIARVFQENGIDGTMLVVDDSSPDGTGDVVKDMEAVYPVRLLSRPKKEGLGAAYKDGFKEALKNGADVIFEMDADFSHKPEYIPQFLAKIEQGADLVIGSRYTKGGKRENCPRHTVLMGNYANLYAKTVVGLPVTDVTTGYRAYRREVLENVELTTVKSNGYEFQLEMIYRTHQLGFRIDEIPIVFPGRVKGKSKLSYKDAVSFLIRALQLRFNAI